MQLPDLIICGLKYGPKWEKPLRRKKSNNGRTKNQSSTRLRGIYFIDPEDGQGDGVSKACLQQAAADPRRSPNLPVCETFGSRVAQAGREGREYMSCCGAVQSAWQVPPVRRTGGKTGLPARVSGRHVVRGRQSSPIPECAWVIGKASENGQKIRRRGGTLFLDKTGGSLVW